MTTFAKRSYLLARSGFISLAQMNDRSNPPNLSMWAVARLVWEAFLYTFTDNEEKGLVTSAISQYQLQ